MKKILFFAIMLAMVLNLSAQRQMYVWQNGVKTTYEVVNVDSITFSKEENPDVPNTGFENGHEYVDLGLSVKWATCNVGATKPEEYGNHFAWGETQPKSTYDWSTYKWGSPESITKYNTSSSFGTVDNKTVLEAADDAATANWGGAWRMPTDAELTELRGYCTWIWTSQNGVYGYKVTSKKSGYTNKSIFLPAAGWLVDTAPDNVDDAGYYWSSSLGTQYQHRAWAVVFNSNNINQTELTLRRFGFSIRPVCP